MATHGNFGAFDYGTEEWMAYYERLEQYFFANDVEDAGKQRAILLSVCGPSMYQLIRNVVTSKAWFTSFLLALRCYRKCI